MPKIILFIEDESALQKTMGDVLRQNGYKIINAFEGETGLNLAKTKNPDLILLDLILPKHQGLDILKKLKEDPKTKGIPIIVLTNLEDAENISKVSEFGANAYLVKSNYSLDEVIEKIKKALNE